MASVEDGYEQVPSNAFALPSKGGLMDPHRIATCAQARLAVGGYSEGGVQSPSTAFRPGAAEPVNYNRYHLSREVTQTKCP